MNQSSYINLNHNYITNYYKLKPHNNYDAQLQIDRFNQYVASE